MLKRQFALIAILIGCVALIACGGEDEEEVGVGEEVGLPSDIANYTSWTSVALDAPPTEVTAAARRVVAHTGREPEPSISTHRVSKPSKTLARNPFLTALRLSRRLWMMPTRSSGVSL